MLSPPPRNLNGKVEPHDHAGIRPDDGVIRRISPHFVVLDKTGQPRISSMAFNPSSEVQGGGLSIDLQAEIEESGQNARQHVMVPPWIGSIRFTAAQLRGEGFMVGYDPLPPQLPFHGEVWGNFSSSKKKQLLRLGEWFVPIEGVALGEC